MRRSDALRFVLPAALAGAFGSFLGAGSASAATIEYPTRKPGLWEMTMQRAAGGAPTMTMQQCTDETTDKRMQNAYSPMSKDMCAKNEIQKTATGFITDSVCTVGGMTTTSHSEVTGDFNAAYTVKVTSQNEGGAAAIPRNSTMTLEAKWVGACKDDQAPGDIVMPGGRKINISDIEKLQGLAPKK